MATYWIAVKRDARDRVPHDWVERLKSIPGLKVPEGARAPRVRVEAEPDAIAVAKRLVGEFCHVESESIRMIEPPAVLP